MVNVNTSYVNSIMDEMHELNSDLYESMIDIDKESLLLTIKKMKKLLNDIQKSYNEEI